MSLWTKGVFGFLLVLQGVPSQAQQTIKDKDWDLTRAYSDVFKILSDENDCSGFYGGSRVATTVLHDFFTHITPQPLSSEVSFQMAGRPRLLRENATGVRYRIFDTAMVNTEGSFYKRRPFASDRFPPDVG